MNKTEARRRAAQAAAGAPTIEEGDTSPRKAAAPAASPSSPSRILTPRKSIRIRDQLWEAAQKKAAEQGETVSAAVRRALEEYVR